MQNVFAVKASDAGQIALIAAEKSPSNFPFRMVMNDTPNARSFPVTISVASPGVLTRVAHGLSVDDVVQLSTTGALPTGLSPATPYYVKTVLTADTFTVSATEGRRRHRHHGGGQRHPHGDDGPWRRHSACSSASCMTAAEQGGEANTARNLNATIEINSNIVRVAAAGD